MTTANRLTQSFTVTEAATVSLAVKNLAKLELQETFVGCWAEQSEKWCKRVDVTEKMQSPQYVVLMLSLFMDTWLF